MAVFLLNAAPHRERKRNSSILKRSRRHRLRAQSPHALDRCVGRIPGGVSPCTRRIPERRSDCRQSTRSNTISPRFYSAAATIPIKSANTTWRRGQSTPSKRGCVFASENRQSPSLSQDREYLITRYGPELAATTSQINRLTATLEEVAAKVTLLIAPSSKRSRCQARP